MRRGKHCTALALLVLMGGCADAGDEETEGELPAATAETVPDLSSFDQDGDGMLAGAEWTAYTTDRLPWHVWDADRSGALEQDEFESGAVGGRASGASFASWDTDGSAGVDGTEWDAAWLALYDENKDGLISAEELATG